MINLLVVCFCKPDWPNREVPIIVLTTHNDQATVPAAHANDGNLLDATRSLTGYIEIMGNSGKLGPQVIIKHLDAIISLVHLVGSSNTKRADVVASLQKLVGQRVHRVS